MVCAFFRKLKNKHAVHVHKAEVAQTGRAPDSIELIEGEAEDRVVAGSSPALGTTMLNWHKPTTLLYFRFQNSLASSTSQTYARAHVHT